MKIFKYLTVRLIILAFVLITLNIVSPYLMPEELRDDKFSFISEALMFLRLSLIFLVLFTAFSIYEINKFQKNKRLQLRNTAIGLCVFLIVLTVPLAYYNIKY